MEKSITPYYFDADSPAFEDSYRQNGQIYWYASTLLTDMLGYDHYTPTMKPLQKAIQVCMSTSIPTADNFREEYRLIAGKQVKDFKLTRFACYLVAMNADVKKPQVAKAQARFAAFADYLAGYMGAEERGANIFRITQTHAKIKRENIHDQQARKAAARQVGKSVRLAIQSMRGTMPENLQRSFEG